jgi:hypothetical protein
VRYLAIITVQWTGLLVTAVNVFDASPGDSRTSLYEKMLVKVADANRRDPGRGAVQFFSLEPDELGT